MFCLYHNTIHFDIAWNLLCGYVMLRPFQLVLNLMMQHGDSVTTSFTFRDVQCGLRSTSQLRFDAVRTASDEYSII